MTDPSRRTIVVLDGDQTGIGTLAESTATPDLGGNVGTTGLTNEVIRRVIHMLDSGETLA